MTFLYLALWRPVSTFWPASLKAVLSAHPLEADEDLGPAISTDGPTVAHFQDLDHVAHLTREVSQFIGDAQFRYRFNPDPDGLEMVHSVIHGGTMHVIDEDCHSPDDHFLNLKRSSREAAADDRFWPTPALVLGPV